MIKHLADGTQIKERLDADDPRLGEVSSIEIVSFQNYSIFIRLI